MLAERLCGNAKAGRDRKSDSAQADKTQGLWPDCCFIDMPGGIQWNNFNLTNDRNSLQIMRSSARLQDCCYMAIIT
jgi:hypothetical protein